MAQAPFLGLKPYGAVDPDLLDGLAGPLRLIFPLPTERLPPAEVPAFAFKASRGQYLSQDILGDLAAQAPPGCVRILGLTDVDLFIPILTFVYGEAMLPGRAAVVSSCRLARDAFGGAVEFRVLRDRVLKEAVHELGHTFGLTHCDNKGCAMSFSHSLEQLDNKQAAFCRYCSVLLTDALRMPF
jgi:archaemetzincin